MCGRFVQYSDPEVYASRFELESICDARPRYNLAPSQSVLAIRVVGGGTRELVPLRWGLVPSWSKGPDRRYSMINARSETVATKPAYRNAFRHGRCLVPTEGFYEWKTENGVKTPFLIRRRDAEPFAMAGLWECWHGRSGEEIQSCVILVTGANQVVRSIHDRMPVVLPPASHSTWLDPENKDADALLAMLMPADPEPWTLLEVSSRVNSPRNDGPELIERAGPH
jgi:putative SOS response-associated peptidase YedK